MELFALAGVFVAVLLFADGDAATVWPAEAGGMNTNPMAASARDTAIFVKPVRVSIEKLAVIVTRLSPIRNRVYSS